MNRTVLVHFFQVTQCVNNEHDETSTGFDVVENLMKRLSPSPVETAQETSPVPSEYELLVQRLCEVAQLPVPEDSDTIDIEQLLRKLIPVGPVVEEAVRRNFRRLTTERRETSPDPGRGVSHPDQ